MTNENEEYLTLRQRLDRIISSCTFYNEFLLDFKQYKRAHLDWNKRSQVEVFDADKSALFYNYQTLMSKNCRDQLGKAKEENLKALKMEPRNFIARCNAVDLALEQGDTPIECIQQHLEDLENISKDEKQMILARTEVAFSYNRLHQMFYEKAITMYEDTFKELPQRFLTKENDPGFLYQVYRAKIGLGKLYNKVSTRAMGNAFVLRYEPRKIYEKVQTLLMDDVINGSEIDDKDWKWAVKKVNGLAWTELAIAANKYICSRDKSLTIEDPMKPDQCFQKALKYIPDGSYQFGKYGQFKRKTAKTMDDYTECIRYLKRALDAEPSNYTLMYEIGMAFKQMWNMGNCDDDIDDEVAGEGEAKDEKKNCKDDDYDSDANSEWEVASSKKKQCFPLAPKNLPKPVKENKHDVRKRFFQNAITSRPHNEYLLESQKYFKMAKEAGNGTDCMNAIELARTYISLGDVENAERTFAEAEQMELNVMHAAYLFEQRALFLKEQIPEDESHEAKKRRDEQIMFYYRECIRYHAECKSQCNTAFHELQELLYRKTQEAENKDSCLLQREYMILFNAINKSKNLKHIIINLTSNKAVREILELIKELYAKIDQDHNSSTALTYLTILHEAGELARVKDPIASTLGISSRAAKVCSYPDHILSNSYTWLMKIKYPKSEKSENSLCMVVMLKDEYVDRITDTLAKCNLPVRLFDAQDQGDIERNSPLKPNDISTLLIVDHPDWDSVNEESRRMIGRMLKKVESKCFVSRKDEKVKRFQQVDLKVWRYDTDGQSPRIEAVKIGFELLNVLFMQ